MKQKTYYQIKPELSQYDPKMRDENRGLGILVFELQIKKFLVSDYYHHTRTTDSNGLLGEVLKCNHHGLGSPQVLGHLPAQGQSQNLYLCIVLLAN